MTDALVEAVRSAMTSYLLENVSPDTVRVALHAIEAAGYRVVPVEVTDPVPTNPVFDQEEAIRRAAPRVGEG